MLRSGGNQRCREGDVVGAVFPADLFVDIYEWLRAGWIDEIGFCEGYLRFLNGRATMESKFADFPALLEFRRALLSVGSN